MFLHITIYKYLTYLIDNLIHNLKRTEAFCNLYMLSKSYLLLPYEKLLEERKYFQRMLLASSKTDLIFSELMII